MVEGVKALLAIEKQDRDTKRLLIGCDLYCVFWQGHGQLVLRLLAGLYKTALEACPFEVSRLAFLRGPFQL